MILFCITSHSRDFAFDRSGAFPVYRKYIKASSYAEAKKKVRAMLQGKITFRRTVHGSEALYVVQNGKEIATLEHCN